MVIKLSMTQEMLRLEYHDRQMKMSPRDSNLRENPNSPQKIPEVREREEVLNDVFCMV